MKKLLLFTFALFLWTGAWAQTNLAAGKSVSVIYLPAEKESPSSEELAKVTDGNTGTNVLLPNNVHDIAAISIDLDGNASTAISTIAVAQDGRHATAYTIYGTNTAPGSYPTKEDLTAAAAAGWTVLASTNDDGNTGGDNTVYIKGYSANSNEGFRYIVFVPTAQVYGVSLRQIFVYDEYTPVYTLKANEDQYIYNAAQKVNFSILDQVGVSGTISAISFANSTYGYDTNLSNPSFTFGADFPNNVDDLNVTVGGNVVTKSFALLKSTPAVGDVPAIDDGTSYVIFSAEKNEKHDVYNGYDGPNTTAINSEFAIAGQNAVLAKKMTYVGFKNNTFNPSKTDMTSLVLDIFVTEPHAKENCHVKAEDQGTLNFPQDLNRGWNHVVLTNFNTSTFAGLTSNTTLFVRIDDAVDENVVIYNLYYSKDVVVDTDAPVITSAVISDIASTSATLTVRATDDVNRTLSFSVKDGETEIATGNGLPSTDVVISLTGLTPGTTYDNLKVYATDQASHTSDAYAIASFTTMTRTVVKSGNGTITVTQSEQERSINYTYEFILEGDNILTLSFESTNGDPGVEGYSNNNSFMAYENDGMLKNGARSYTWNNAVEGITYGAKCVWPAAGVQCKTPYITYSVPEILPEPASLTIDASKVVYNVYCDDSDYKSKGGNHFWQVENMQGEGAVAQEVELASGDHAYSVKLATSFDIRYKDGDVSENGTYYCYIALYPTGDVTSLTITPLFWNNHGNSFVQTVTPNKWNYIYFNEEQYRDAAGGHYAVRISGMEANTIYFDNVFYSATLPVKIGSHGYTTLISDKTLDFGDATLGDLTAYSAKRKGTTVTLNKVGEVPANKGLVLQGTANETYYIPVLASTEATVETHLTGNATAPYELVSGKHYYVLSNVGGAEGFYHYTGLDNIPAGKAFFETDEELSIPGADYMSIIFGDDEPSGETTRINAVNIDLANEAAYNLAGQRVGNDYKGIVIVNGKKYLRK